MTPLRLLLLDDHILFREGLNRLLVSEPDFEIVALCGTPAEALNVLGHCSVEVVLLDFELEDDTGTRFISSAISAGYRGRILMVTAGMTELDSSIAWKLGISGIFLKHNSPSTLLQAIRTVAEGGVWIDQKMPPPPSAVLSQPGVKGFDGHLTPREQHVLRSVFEGLTNKEIAYKVGVSQSSVKGTLQQLFDKTGVRTRSQLVRFALERSLETTRRKGTV